MKHVLAVLALSTLVGCADQLVSTDRIRDSTAFALGVPAASVRIADRAYDGVFLTKYTAITPSGVFHCSIGGGSVAQMGILEPPECGSASAPAPVHHRKRSANR